VISSPRLAWALAVTATFTMAVSYVDRQTLAVLAPTVTEKLGIGEEAYGWLVSAFSIAYLVGAPAAGWMVDAVGARRGLFGAVLVWTAVAALHALVPGFGVLFALRIALGLAESPSFPGAAQTITRALPPAEQGRGFGLLFTGSSFGAMIAPPLATWLERHWNWRVAFLGTALAGLCWVPVWWALAFRGEGRRALDGEAGTNTRTTTSTSTSKEGGGRMGVFLHPAVLRALLAVIATAPVISFALNWGAKYLVRDHHFVQADVGRYLWLPPLLFDVGSLGFGFVASRQLRLGAKGPPRALLATAGLLTMAVALVPYGGRPWPCVVLLGVAMCGGGGVFAVLTSDMMLRVPRSVVSTAGGLTAAAQSLAYIASSPLVGRGVARWQRYDEVMLALGLWVIPGVIAWLVWRPPPLRAL
jgi:MFS transporter, ACS family, hexuronate transporter